MNLVSYLEKHPKKFLVFDLDETILRLRLPWHNYLRPIKDDLVKKDPDIVENYLNNIISLSDLQNLYIHKDRSLVSFIKNYNEKFEAQLEHYDPNPNIIDFIKNDTTHVLYLWSSNTRVTVEKTLKMEGILHCFETVVTRSDVDFIKPETEGFSHIFLPGNNLDDYLFIGDSKADREASQNIGIDFFEISYFKLIA